MPTARCTLCAANFPVDQVGQDCPICELQTLEGIENDAPHDASDLKSRVNAAKFERWLEEHDRA